jgi:signal transduction histidine kinase
VTYPNEVSDRATGGALSAPMQRALTSAADRAVGRLVGRSEDSVAVFRGEMKHLADLVCSAAQGKTDVMGIGGSPTFSPELVDLLRFEFLTLLNESRPKRMTAREVLSILTAMESIASRSDHRASDSAESRPASADALNGMLEIAHDMRSPLAAILLLVEPIRRGQQGAVTPIQERQLGLIYGAALSLSTLANDIIDAARGECVGTSVQHPFSISRTIQDACAVVRPIAEEKGLEFGQVLPTVDGRLGDAAGIHRVLLNLTSNALKYTEEGSVTVGCTELDDSRVEFWVKDTGRGIPDQVVARLFDEFRPGPVGSRFFSAGLGLTICRRLLKAMDSTLRVETALEKGTRFSFVLELGRVDGSALRS